MNKEKLKAIIAVLAAVILTGIGVALYIGVNIGSDTVTVFVDGLHKTLNIRFGLASFMYNVGMLILALIVSRKSVGWATIVYALLVGSAIDGAMALFAPIPFATFSIVSKLLCVLLAQVCFGIAFALLIIFQNGMNQIDAVAYYVADKLNMKYVYIRTMIDVITITIGYLLGGVVGIGSIIAMATTGYFVSLALKIMKYEQE